MFLKARKHILTSVALGLLCTTILAQDQMPEITPAKVAFSHLDVGVSAGTTGLGIGVSTPLTSWLKVRGGLSWVPQFNMPMTFELETYNVKGENTGKIHRLQELMADRMGIIIDDYVDMNAKSTMVDVKLMFDFYPIPNNKHWSVTAGFYWGSSKIGHIENDIKDAPTMVGVMVYNKLYEWFVEEKYIEEPVFGDVFIDPDNLGDPIRDKFHEFGRLGALLGYFKDTGKPYIMEPDEDGMVKANMYVNHFKPYLGFGYETALDQKQKWHFGTRFGVLFWGGSPDIYTHPNLNMTDNPRVNLSKDVKNIPGKVGDYVSLVSSLKVYPALNLSLSYTIF